MPPEVSRILLRTANPDADCPAHAALTAAGYEVACQAFDSGVPDSWLPYQLLILDGRHDPDAALSWCRRIRQAQGDGYLPVLLLSGDAGPSVRVAALEHGADACLSGPFDADELLAQAQALVRLQQRHRELSRQAREAQGVNQRLQQAYQQIEQELDLARRIQHSFLPQELPEPPTVRFAVHYRPVGRVGGDFYDAFRLDEKHVGFFVADAVGHGLPASLLTIFVKKGIKPKEIFGQQYRLVPPHEVLQRLNRDLIAEQLSDMPFITMVYVLLDWHNRELSFSRSGHPHPLYLPRSGEPVWWRGEGSLLGVFDTTFPTKTHQLSPGDKVLLYTDGIDAAGFEDQPLGTPSLLACARRHRELPIQELVNRLAQELFGRTRQADDLTLLGLEVLA
jgi:sigma-B regulation protein RsbU (phosphoserine phosphatase)